MEPLTRLISDASYRTIVGSTLVLGFAAFHLKALPFVSTARILPSLYRVLKPRLGKRRPRKALPIPCDRPVAASHALFKHHILHSRAIITDLDINIHKSNSTFFADADLGRAALLSTLLGEGQATLGANFILASVTCRFRQEIRPYQAYAVSSRILAWNEKALYVVTYFLKPGRELPLDIDVLGGPGAVLSDDKYRKAVFAVLVSKYVFKAGRTTVAPVEVLTAAGLLTSQDQTDAGGVHNGFQDMIDVDQAVQHGLEYVRACME